MANQAWQITAPGVLTLNTLDSPTPKPGPGQVLLRVHAISYNYRDVLVIDHSPHYAGPAKPNLIPCSDAAGVIQETYPGSKWNKGDRVVICGNSWVHGINQRDFNIDGTLGATDLDGTLRRWMVYDEERLVEVPAHLSLEEAASIHTAGVTSFRALFHGPSTIGPGTTVLTQGTGGVSCFAVQFAAAAGATVIATSSSDEKLELAKKLGAKHLINYRTRPDWATEVLTITKGEGVDFVLENIGAEGIVQSVKSTRYGGAIVSVGVLSENPRQPVDIMLELLYGAKTLMAHLGAGSRDVLAETVAFMQEHGIHPQLAGVWDFEEADKALEATRKLSAPGKIVVKV